MNPHHAPVGDWERRARAAIVPLACLLIACTAPAAPRQTTTEAPDTARPPEAREAQSAAPTAPKRLIVGMLGERQGWAPWHASAGTAFVQPVWLVNRSLTTIDGRGAVKPVLAASVPTLSAGDWKINPDGSMEQTWKIRPEARWQDGHPLTADDFVFGWELLTQRELPTGGQSPARSLISGASAPDPYTFMISFVGTTPLAGASMFDPYPRHILGDLYSTGDWESLINHEYWTSEYVAAGPYRFTAWEPGTYQEFSAFEGYIEGKPKIDKIIFRFFGDANTLMANILSGDVDAALPDGISAVAAAELKQTWGAPGTGNTVILYRDGRYSRVEFQHRAEYAMPRAARDPRVRRAFYHTIDKEGLNEVALAGLGKLADSWIAPTDPLRPQFEDVIPKWSYDLSLASRILEDAGWRKGSDGIYVSGATGERLETEIQTSLSARGQAIAILSNGWRQVGADVNENALPSAMARDREFRAKLPFAGLVTHFVDLQYEYQQHSCERASSAENRWSGAHYGYCSADANPLIMKLQVTIPEDERTALRHDIMRVMLQEDMALLPMYWYVTVLVRAKGVTGLDELEQRAFRTQPPWNAHLWDRT